ncbi:MAG: pyridoxal phosphate-dependent aminotransferase [Chromatiales bacterium]|jgi:cysteine-S-conjugate beta-lyase|nr:pyridoxal phosphate-dependent aminotransferase [Chromatiales bacterium]
MPEHDFDQEIVGQGTNSVKWEFRVEDGVPRQWDRANPELGDDQVLPMWVADMDFQVAQPIINALQARVAHGVFGYARATERYGEAIRGWMEARQGWQPQPEWMVWTPGVVPALHLIVREFTKSGEKVLIQRPVYHPFAFCAERNQRVPISNSLLFKNGQYQMDYEDLEEKARQRDVTLAIVCSPHNPVGRVWNADELNRFAEICVRHGVLMVLDEIHGDLIMPGHRFVPFGSLNSAYVDHAIICTSPSKSFNLAGLHSSNLFISNEVIRERFQTQLQATAVTGMNPLSIAATQAAYESGGEWLDGAISYIFANLNHLDNHLRAHLPDIRLIHPQGTYLAWLDCRALRLNDDALSQLLMDEARIYTDVGHIFGPEGSGFCRINVACPRSVLNRALQRLTDAVAKRQ